MHWSDRIFQEKSFSSVFLKARSVCSSRVNLGAAVLIFAIAAIYTVADICDSMSWMPFASIATTIRAIGDIGLTITTQLLGFLIAGFAIFASITKPEIFVMLARMNHSKGGITRLQFIFFNFLYVFIHFTLFLAVSVFIKVILVPNGPLSVLLQWLLANYTKTLISLAGISFCILLGWLVFILMLLKSFIWNMYQSILLAIATNAEMTSNDQPASK